MNEKIDIKKVIDYWKQGAEKNYQTAKFLYRGKKYVDCLFFCHLMLEKILKGLVVANIKTHAPYIHDLNALAEKTKINLTKEQIEELEEINTFNIQARYDNEKYEFYKQCNKFYTEKYFKICEELYLWLKKKYQ